MLEQGTPYADEADAPFLEKLQKASAEKWRKKALEAYRRAFDLSIEADLRKKLIGPQADDSIALEAGKGILRLQEGRKLTKAEKLEIAPIQEAVQTLKRKPHTITPIIFPLNRNTSLHALVSPHRIVTFDLDGDGEKEHRLWINPNAGILVWDSERTGHIASSRQLFGSVTWWMFWRNGYEPLAALDDNQDGWLSGKELDGIGVWCDRNSNGVSEVGEVMPLSALSIKRIAVQAAEHDGEVLYNPKGIQFRNGKFLPTYDWVSSPLAVSGLW